MLKTTFVATLLRSANREKEGLKFPIELRYEPEKDPLAVTAHFPVDDPDDPIVWTFARELLARGSQSLAPYGEGDVKLRKLDDQHLIMCLVSPDGHADVGLPLGAVNAFLEGSYDLVHAGEEFKEGALDAFLEEVLGS